MPIDGVPIRFFPQISRPPLLIVVFEAFDTPIDATWGRRELRA